MSTPWTNQLGQHTIPSHDSRQDVPAGNLHPVLFVPLQLLLELQERMKLHKITQNKLCTTAWKSRWSNNPHEGSWWKCEPRAPSPAPPAAPVPLRSNWDRDVGHSPSPNCSTPTKAKRDDLYKCKWPKCQD